jgi:hypothetical protein
MGPIEAKLIYIIGNAIGWMILILVIRIIFFFKDRKND